MLGKLPGGERRHLEASTFGRVLPLVSSDGKENNIVAHIVGFRSLKKEFSGESVSVYYFCLN